MSLKTTVAKFFSLVFHPLWMPLLGFTLAVANDQYLIASRSVYQAVISVLFINVLVPMAMIVMMIKFKMVSGIDLRERKERLVPYLIVVGFYVFSYALFQYRDLPISNLLYAYFLGIILVMFSGLLINFVWKISVHLLAVGGVLGWLLALSVLHHLDIDLLLFLVLLAVGFTAFSRLYLKAHTPAQVYLGFLLGFAIEFLLVYNRFFIHLF